MPDQPAAGPAHAKDAAESPAETDTMPPSPIREPSKATTWLTYLALAVAVIAIALAALAYFHPPVHQAAGPVQQGGDAKVNVCTAAAKAREGVVINTHLRRPENNPIGELAVAANARLALVGGGVFLQQRLAANNAAPADLVAVVNSLANDMQQLGVSYLAGVSTESLDPLRHDLDAAIDQVSKACS